MITKFVRGQFEWNAFDFHHDVKKIFARQEFEPGPPALKILMQPYMQNLFITADLAWSSKYKLNEYNVNPIM